MRFVVEPNKETWGLLGAFAIFSTSLLCARFASEERNTGCSITDICNDLKKSSDDDPSINISGFDDCETVSS